MRAPRSLLGYLTVLLLGGCGGGSCSSCGAVQPIHGGFPLVPDRRIPHAIQVRLSGSGLQEIQAMGPDLLRGFLGTGLAVPTVKGNFGVGKYVICPGGGCTLAVDVPSTPPGMELAFQAPDQINVRIRAIIHGTIPVITCTLTCSDDCTGSFCPAPSHMDINIDTRTTTPGYLGLQTNAAIRRDQHTPRRDYFRADFIPAPGATDTISETPGEGLDPAAITCTNGALCGVFGLFRGTIVDQFRGQIGGALGPLQEALAQKAMPDPPGCPTGTAVNGTHCRYTDDSTQVPTLLGMDGEGNFGDLLASITPGVTAENQLVIAGGDPTHNAEVTAAGATVNVLGAVISQRHNACVPTLTPPATPSIPEWMALRRNLIPGTTIETDLGLGIAEDFLDHAAWHLWDSGMFCLGVTTRTSQLLNTNTLGAVVQSLRQVVFPRAVAPLALVLRPQTPPDILVGGGSDVATDPLLTISLRTLDIDFYAWSEERYIRFMTAETDLTVPMNLVPDTGGLRPVLGDIGVNNTTVSNNDLLRETPAALSSVVSTVLGFAVPMLGGSIPSISLPSIPIPGAGGATAGQLEIFIPAEGVHGVDEGGSRFLGLFTDLTYHSMAVMPSTLELDTNVDAEVLSLPNGLTPARVGFTVSSPPSATPSENVEYALRVDHGTWTAFSKDTHRVLQLPGFTLPGTHLVEARARAANQPATADREPAVREFVIRERPSLPLGAPVPEVTAGALTRELPAPPSVPTAENDAPPQGQGGCSTSRTPARGAGILVLGALAWRLRRRKSRVAGRVVTTRRLRSGPLETCGSKRPG